jgi:putative transcriptional regulator
MRNTLQDLPTFMREALDDDDRDGGCDDDRDGGCDDDFGEDRNEDWREVTSALAEASATWLPVVPPAADELLEAVNSPRLRYAPFFNQLSELWQLDHAALEAFFADDRWSRTPLRGIRVREVALPTQLSDCRARVSLFDAGLRFPRHTHHALEQVLVMEGSYTDTDTGVTYGPGDLHAMPAGTTHGFRVSLDGRCVAASIHNAPFAFHSWPLRVLARLTGH